MTESQLLAFLADYRVIMEKHGLAVVSYDKCWVEEIEAHDNPHSKTDDLLKDSLPNCSPAQKGKLRDDV